MEFPIWALNAAIVLSGLVIALLLLRLPQRTLYACSAFVCGFLWHFIRGYKQYTDMACSSSTEDHWLVILDKCIPMLDADIVIAQALVIAGAFAIFFIIYKKLEEQYGNEDLS